MIALDTNVLVRLLVFDEPRQAERARRLVEQATSKDESIFLSSIVLCELVWVLRGAVDAPKKDIVATLNRLLDSELFVFENAALLRTAIDRFTSGRADFADYLLGEVASDAGASVTFTFDRTLQHEPGFSLV